MRTFYFLSTTLAALALPSAAALAALPTAEEIPELLQSSSQAAEAAARASFKSLGTLVEFQLACKSTSAQRARLQRVLSQFERKLEDRFGPGIVPDFRRDVVQGADEAREQWEAATRQSRDAACAQFIASEERELVNMEKRVSTRESDSNPLLP